MQKTIHRIMWMFLTPDQFKNWNRQTPPIRINEMQRKSISDPSQILAKSFGWKHTKEGYTYWAELAYIPPQPRSLLKVTASEAALVKVHTYEGTPNQTTHQKQIPWEIWWEVGGQPVQVKGIPNE